jgi:hypothetical protein
MQMQSHGLNMTSVSIKQLKDTLRQKSIRTQNAVKDKTGNSLTAMVQTISNTNVHEDLNLILQITEERIECTVLLQ